MTFEPWFSAQGDLAHLRELSSGLRYFLTR